MEDIVSCLVLAGPRSQIARRVFHGADDEDIDDYKGRW